MIANFFRNLTDQRVQYLPISGQASVLYGAATFSEDIDLWVNPSVQNLDRFLTAPRNCGTCLPQPAIEVVIEADVQSVIEEN